MGKKCGGLLTAGDYRAVRRDLDRLAVVATCQGKHANAICLPLEGRELGALQSVSLWSPPRLIPTLRQHPPANDGVVPQG